MFAVKRLPKCDSQSGGVSKCRLNIFNMRFVESANCLFLRLCMHSLLLKSENLLKN